MHLFVELLDRSSPNASRRILRGTSSTRSAGRTPHQTATGLPGRLDLEIAASPHYFPSHGFWQDLGEAPTTRLGEQWESLAERELNGDGPSIEWTEPDSVKPKGQGGSTFTPAPTLDYRFGPISLDWIDEPASHPAFGGAMLPTAAVASPEASTSALQLPATPSASTSRTPNPLSRQPSHHGGTTTSAAVQPTALYVPDPTSPPANGKQRYQLGTTDLGYGTVHLYRDARDAERDMEAQRWSSVVSPSATRTRASSAAANGSMPSDGTVVGVLAIPSYMTASDFLAFIAPSVESIESIRILRDAMPNRAMGLIRFRTPHDARNFAKDFDGRPFSHLQDREICHVARIESVEVKKSLIPPFTFPALLPPELQADSHELPTCPVCLERMDSTVTGLMTIPCSHTFHCNCLSKWGDSRCPVCRYSQTRLRSSTANRHPSDAGSGPSECAACGSEANLWICLICGHVGCGRYQGGHAHRHFEETSHTYALELGSQRVWDYVGDGYVHRLIQTKNDEIVELPALSSAVFDSGGGPGRDAVAHQSKIEAISEEFGHLVASQLDSQRAYYEKELRFVNEDLELARTLVEEGGEYRDRYEKERIRREGLERKIEELLAEGNRSRDDVARLNRLETEIIPELERDKTRLEKKADKALELARRFERELATEKSMSQNVHAKMAKMEGQRKEGDERTAALENQVKDLNEQLRDVMFFLDASTKIKNEGGEEMQGGSVSLPPTASPASASKSRRKKK